jgi:hypothetical protein
MLESSGVSRLAEPGSNWDESTAGDFNPPLDLVHLARQCLGDHELEAELLGLFRLQAPALTAQLADQSLLSLESKAKIAHKLRKSTAFWARRADGGLPAQELGISLPDSPGEVPPIIKNAVPNALSAPPRLLYEGPRRGLSQFAHHGAGRPSPRGKIRFDDQTDFH